MTPAPAAAEAGTTTVGVIADTHGLLRTEALRALEGVAHILHAGDIGRPQVLESLARLAPVTAVRGNVDRWADALPAARTVCLGGWRIHLLHDLKTLAIDPEAEGIAVVVSGHSHRPAVDRRGGVLYLNPGSAGPRRFRLPVALARLRLSPQGTRAELVELMARPGGEA